MNARLIALSISLAALTACATTTDGSSAARDLSGLSWSAEGTWTDACCCQVACPCLFGNGPTEGYCEGASLFEVDSGHVGDVSLDGVAAVISYRVGGWSHVEVDESASAEQVAAFGAIAPGLLPFIAKGVAPEIVAGPLVIQQGDQTISFSSPATDVELELVRSESGEPVVHENLPAKGTPFPPSTDHVQYESRLLSHDSDHARFRYSGRNGYRSHFEAAGP